MTKRELNEKITRLEKFAAEHLQGLQKQIDTLRENKSESRMEKMEDEHRKLRDFALDVRDVVRALIILGNYPSETLMRAIKEAEKERESWLPKPEKLEKEETLFSKVEKPAAELFQEIDNDTEKRRKYYRDKDRPQVRSWARRFHIPVRIFVKGMKGCGIEGAVITPRDTTEVQYRRLTKGEAYEVFEHLCAKVGELK